MEHKDAFSAASYFNTAMAEEKKPAREYATARDLTLYLLLDPLFMFFALPVFLFLLSIRLVFYPLAKAACSLGSISMAKAK